MCKTYVKDASGVCQCQLRGKKYVLLGGFTVNDLITLRFHAPQTTLGLGSIGYATYYQHRMYNEAGNVGQ